MEREIRFEENGIITLKEGVVVSIEGDGFKVVSSDRKEVVHFNKEGKVIDKLSDAIRTNGCSAFGCFEYFEKMGKKERKEVKHWLRIYKAKNEQEEAFLNLVDKATKEVQYGYHIATIEASFDGEKIYYCENNKVPGYPTAIFDCVDGSGSYNDNSKSCIKLSEEEWHKKAQEFAPQYKSKVATLYELYYWYAYKIATGEWTLEDICKAPSRYKIIVLRGM